MYLSSKLIQLYKKINNFENNLQDLEERITTIESDIDKNILTPEEMAKEIIKIKLPISDLPPDLIKEFENISSGANISTSKKDSLSPSYVG